MKINTVTINPGLALIIPLAEVVRMLHKVFYLKFSLDHIRILGIGLELACNRG